MREITSEDKLTKYSQLSQLAKDFVKAAKSYGKIIIEEVTRFTCVMTSQTFLDNKHKTIKPWNEIGGQAGGTFPLTNTHMLLRREIPLSRHSIQV